MPHIVCLRPALTTPPAAAAAVRPSLLLPVTQTASLSQKEKKKLAKQDPYRWAQMQQRKNAHLERRAQLKAERLAARGDPIRGMTTPFVESFDSGGQAPVSRPRLDDDGNPVEEPHALPTSPHILRGLLHRDEVDAAIQNAYMLTSKDPALLQQQKQGQQQVQEGEEDMRLAGGEDDGLLSITEEVDAQANPEALRREREEEAARHARAQEAVRRITHLSAGTAKDRLHANVRRILETFGRHVTDHTLTPKAPSRGQTPREPTPRAGPDTGSSEVQIAILTAKIRALANELETGRGYKDKVGKRDLRLLVHRRQRLLKYMERKERGSGRWKHMIETLGLTEATWKGQISM